MLLLKSLMVIEFAYETKEDEEKVTFINKSMFMISNLIGLCCMACR